MIRNQSSILSQILQKTYPKKCKTKLKFEYANTRVNSQILLKKDHIVKLYIATYLDVYLTEVWMSASAHVQPNYLNM